MNAAAFLMLAGLMSSQTAGTPASQTTPSASAVQSVPFSRLKFSETRRHLTVSRHEELGIGGRQSEAYTRSEGKTSIEFDVPLQSAGALPADTVFTLRVGGLKFGAPLASDPAYTPDRTTATLRMTVKNAGTDTTHTIASARLRWEKGRLTGKIEADSGYVTLGSVAASRYINNDGKVEGETDAELGFGPVAARTFIAYKGKSGNKWAAQGNLSGSDISVRISGEVRDRP